MIDVIAWRLQLGGMLSFIYVVLFLKFDQN